MSRASLIIRVCLTVLLTTLMIQIYLMNKDIRTLFNNDIEIVKTQAKMANSNLRSVNLLLELTTSTCRMVELLKK